MAKTDVAQNIFRMEDTNIRGALQHVFIIRKDSLVHNSRQGLSTVLTYNIVNTPLSKTRKTQWELQGF